MSLFVPANHKHQLQKHGSTFAFLRIALVVCFTDSFARESSAGGTAANVLSRWQHAFFFSALLLCRVTPANTTNADT